jgi:hypothetical protein
MSATQVVASLERILQRLPVGDPASGGHWVADGTSIVAAAERHGVLGILDRGQSITPGGMAPEAEAHLRRRAALQRLIQSEIDEALTEVLCALSEAGVVAVPLKGPVLGARLHGDPALRVSTDLDVMVAREDVAAATAALARIGYQGEPNPEARLRWKHQHHLTFLRPDSPPVELHFRLIADFGVVIPSQEFLTRAEPYQTRAGASCRVLAAEDELLFLVLHAAGHLFARLAWLYDVKALVGCRPDINWRVVAERAARFRVGRAFGFAMNHIAERMAIELPEPAIRFGVSRPRRAALAAILAAAERSSGRRAKVLGHLFRLTLCDGPGQGACYLGCHLHRVAQRP